MMLRINLAVILILLGAAQAAAQGTFSMADVPSTANDALFITLSDDHRIEAHFFARGRTMAGFDFVRIPLNAEKVTADPLISVLHQKYDASVVLSYLVTPKLAQQDIVTLDVVPDRLDFTDERAFDSTMPGRGLTIKQNGLRRLLVWDLSPSGSLPMPISQTSRLPDAIAFGFPKEYRGRTLPGSGSMFDPTPVSGPNPAVFTRASLSDGRIQIAYDLREPAAFETIVKTALKFVGMLLPILLLRLTQPEKVNATRFRMVFWGLLGAITLIYGALIAYSLYLGAPLLDVLIDLGFAIMTAALAALTAWLVQKRPAPPQMPPAV